MGGIPLLLSGKNQGARPLLLCPQRAAGGLRLIDNSPFAIKVVCKGVRGMEGTKGHFVESGEAVVNKLRPKL